MTFVYKNKAKINQTNVMISLVDFLYLFVLLMSSYSSIALAQEIESNSKELSLKQLLLMPGNLTKPHAKVEPKCQACHLHFDKSNQSPLCLDCHEQINDDLILSLGFHSKIEKTDIEQCSSCHTDHKGRGFNITALDKDHFNHDNTEFSLNDSHASLGCNDCHKAEDKNFRIKLNEGTCSSCHEDPHKGDLDNDCAQCHDEKSWQVSQFDHSKTDFLLNDKHKELACSSCHVNDVAVELGDQCVNCHLSKDKHFNVFGNKCQDCHREIGWDKTNYDHFKETKFRLLGKHEKLTCESCHTSAYSKTNSDDHSKKQKLKETCVGCHKNDDVHLGSNGSDCKQCHNNTDWEKSKFKHNDDTDFLLQGAHEKLTCDVCHLADDAKVIKNKNVKQKDNTVRVCNDCHQITDPHDGNLGDKCQNCHEQNKWYENVTFNHDFTFFPLTGAHKLQVCQSCHFSSDFTFDSYLCTDCHREDDSHKPSLGDKCTECHNTSSWTTWQFDHQLQTKYPLEGAHENLTCVLCHTNKLSEPLLPPQTCTSCHQNDDIHQGAFGRNCKQCHNTDGFYDFKH